MTDREKANRDTALLMQMLPEINFLGKSTQTPMSWEDEINSGLRKMLCEIDKVPLWFTFAFHLWLDIHHTLRNEVSGIWRFI